MRSILLTKTCGREIGYTGQALETHEKGTLIIPYMNLYIRPDKKIVGSLTGSVRQDHLSPEPEIHDSPQNALQHILLLGRSLYGDYSFYHEFEVDDKLVRDIVETRRQIEEGPAKLAQLVQQAFPKTGRA